MPRVLNRWQLAGALALALIVIAQTLLHRDERAGYLYLTTPAFPVGAGVGADGYVWWMEGHPVYQEAWQFARQAELLAGATDELTTGDHDARAAYSFLGALLAPLLSYYGAMVALNVLAWFAASLAVWYCASRLLASSAAAFGAALLAATGQGFVFMAGTPMSYTAGYAFGALLVALALRWRLFGWSAPLVGWLLFGWLCGVSGLFYFTHVVLVGVLWLFGAGRAPLRHLLLATATAFSVPAAWFVAGQHGIGLRFAATTAGDLFGQARILARIAVDAPLLLPGAAGHGSVRALVGGFSVPVLALAFVGIAAARPRLRAWYLATILCGLGPVLVLHMLPVTQRYGYLAYTGMYVAAADGLWRLLAVAQMARVSLPAPALSRAALAALALFGLARANADLLGIYGPALGFGGP